MAALAHRQSSVAPPRPEADTFTWPKIAKALKVSVGTARALRAKFRATSTPMPVRQRPGRRAVVMVNRSELLAWYEVITAA